MDAWNELQLSMTRRHLFRQTGLGLGVAALSQFLPSEAVAALGHHYAPRAKRAIYLFMAGAPCQMDLFDYKPKMDAMYDVDLPESVRQGQRLTTMTSGQTRFPIAPSKFKFKQYGAQGTWVSELLPYHAKMIDDITLIKSVHTEAINHDPAITYICTGHQLPGRASLGAWLSYGLGAINDNLPSFIVMTPTWSGRRQAQALYNRLWGSGFLPSEHQGVAPRSSGDPVLYLSNPPGISSDVRRGMLDRLAKFNERTYQELGDPETRVRMQQAEMAFRMQTSVPDLVDLSQESAATLEMYGPQVNKPGTFAASCLLARRMVERDVRFVQIFHRGWDQHGNVGGDLPMQCHDVDQPCWALIRDLQQRGLLEDTLVIWGGEFGRTIYSQGSLSKENYGRDHHPRCFTIWMAGGGVRPGLVHGATDDFSYNITENPVHIHDLNATILHCLGIDHRQLSYRFQGLDVRLTGVEEHAPVQAILS